MLQICLLPLKMKSDATRAEGGCSASPHLVWSPIDERVPAAYYSNHTGGISGVLRRTGRQARSEPAADAANKRPDGENL